MREWKMRYGQKCKAGICRSGKVGSKSQGWKMQELVCCMGSRTAIIQRDRLKLLTENYLYSIIQLIRVCIDKPTTLGYHKVISCAFEQNFFELQTSALSCWIAFLLYMWAYSGTAFVSLPLLRQ